MHGVAGRVPIEPPVRHVAEPLIEAGRLEVEGAEPRRAATPLPRLILGLPDQGASQPLASSLFLDPEDTDLKPAPDRLPDKSGDEVTRAVQRVNLKRNRLVIGGKSGRLGQIEPPELVGHVCLIRLVSPHDEGIAVSAGTIPHRFLPCCHLFVRIHCGASGNYVPRNAITAAITLPKTWIDAMT